MLSEIFLYFSIIFYDKYISGANEEEAKVAQINHMSFKYPTSPLLSQPENTAEESVCSLEKRSKECADTPLFCECIRMIEVSPNKNVDIVLIDQGKSSKRFIFIIQVHCFFIFFLLLLLFSFHSNFRFLIQVSVEMFLTRSIYMVITQASWEEKALEERSQKRKWCFWIATNSCIVIF